jgi:hypothetical protein
MVRPMIASYESAADMIDRPCLRIVLFLFAKLANGAAISLRSDFESSMYFSSCGVRSQSRSMSVTYPSRRVRRTIRPMKSCHSSTLGGPAFGSDLSTSLSGVPTRSVGTSGVVAGTPLGYGESVLISASSIDTASSSGVLAAGSAATAPRLLWLGVRRVRAARSGRGLRVPGGLSSTTIVGVSLFGVSGCCVINWYLLN